MTADKVERYDGFWLHPQAELRTGVADKDGGRAVFLKQQASTGIGTESAALAPGTLLLAETALLRAETYEKMVAKMEIMQRRWSSSAEGELLRLMHPVGVGGIREKIEHNWHTADGELDPFTGELDPLLIRSGHGLVREIRAVENAHGGAALHSEGGDDDDVLSAPPDLREARHRLSVGEVEKLWKSREEAKAKATEEESQLLGIWPVASLINHSFARPNVARSFSKVVVENENGKENEHEVEHSTVKLIVQYRLIRKLRPGEEVLDNYLDLASTFQKRYQVEHEQHKMAASLCTPDAFDGAEATEKFMAVYKEIKQQGLPEVSAEGQIEMLFGLCGAIAEAMDLGGEEESHRSTAGAGRDEGGAAGTSGVEETPDFHGKRSCDADASPGSTATSASSEGGDVGGEGDAEATTPKESAAPAPPPAPYRDPAAYPILLQFGKALFTEGFREEAVNMGCRALELVLAREDFSFHSCLVLATLCHWMAGGKDETKNSNSELEAMDRLRKKHFRIVFGETFDEGKVDREWKMTPII